MSGVAEVRSAVNNALNGVVDSGILEKIRTDAEFAKEFRDMRRSDLLPVLFGVRGQRFDLEDYPQFRDLYDLEYRPQLLYKCGRQVGKSMNLSRYEVMNCIQIPHFQILYVAPLQSQTNRYSSLYLKEAINTCAYAKYLQSTSTAESDVATIIRQVGHQTWSNGSGIQLTYAKTSADRARGIFCDELDCDEIQDHLVDNIAVIMQSLTQSEWGIRRYTGTAKTLDNTIEFYWRKTSMNEWAMPCTCVSGESGRFWNIPGEYSGHPTRTVLDMITVGGLVCLNCGKPLDVTKGQWVAADSSKSRTFVGYHVPQIVVPAIVNSPRKWSELVYKVMNDPTASVYQEVLGISSSLGARLINQDDIDKHCTLPTMAEMQAPHWRKRYVHIVAGIDWGVAEQTSFTVLVLLGLRRDGKMDMIWAKRYVGFDTDSLLADIAKTCRFYKVSLVCADFGMGFAQNQILATRFGLPMTQIQYTRQSQLMNYRPILNTARWTVDKVTAMEMFFWALRYGHFAFPPKSESDRYTKDFLSPYEEISEEGGIEVKRFARNPNLPDDATHACCFAMLGGMRLVNSSLVNVIPTGAMGADTQEAAAPDRDKLRSSELLKT